MMRMVTGYRVALLSGLGNRLPTHFHPLFLAYVSVSASVTVDTKTKRRPLDSSVLSSIFTTEQLQSHSFLLLILPTSWPVDQAMASQIPLATRPILILTNREATLQNRAPTVVLPQQIQAKSL